DPPPADPSGRRPIVSPNWSTWPNIRHSLVQVAELTAYRLGFHAIPAPWYALLACFWATVGAFRLIGRQLTWWWVSGQYGPRQAAADTNAPAMGLKLHREVKATRAWRGIVLLAELLAAAIGGPILWAAAPRWALALGIAGAVVLLARFGRPEDRRIITP